jgi:hypothetical protein
MVTGPERFDGSRWEAVLVLCGCCAFGLVGWWLWSRGSSAWWTGVAFLLGVPIAVVQLLPGSTYVELGSRGLVSCVLFRRHCTPWSDIDRFCVAWVGGRKVVGISYRAGAAKAGLRRIARSLSGVEGALPSCSIDPHDLADKLNAALAAQQAAAADAPQAARG